MSRVLLLVLLLLLPLAALADGFAFGKGRNEQLRETHQLAVIHLTETTADVSMFIAIDQIPAGEEITYILPFWHQPQGFSMVEESDSAFRESVVTPAHAEAMRVQKLANRRASATLLQHAGFGLGVAPYIALSPKMMGAGRQGNPGEIIPYATSETRHAQAELYKIDGLDLQRLLRQSGLPARYLQPLRKYTTPYFAVMRLRGLAVGKQEGEQISGQGVRYHFTHQLADGKYTYPLGTGAAWPTPIPLTEIYLTCPPSLQMAVTAPVEGKYAEWERFMVHMDKLERNRRMTPEERRDWQAEDEDWLKDALATQTASLTGLEAHGPFAWHIAYSHSNPDTDITIRMTPRPLAWRFAVVEAIGGHIGITMVILYLLAWALTTRFVIYPRWKRAETNESLPLLSFLYLLRAQAVGFLAMTAVLCLLPFVELIRGADNKSMMVFAAVISSGILAIFVIGGIRYFRQPAENWRKWLSIQAWLASVAIFAVLWGTLSGVVFWGESL